MGGKALLTRGVDFGYLFPVQVEEGRVAMEVGQDLVVMIVCEFS